MNLAILNGTGTMRKDKVIGNLPTFYLSFTQMDKKGCVVKGLSYSRPWNSVVILSWSLATLLPLWLQICEHIVFLSSRPNDRVISINGILLEDSYHREAISLLRNCGNMADMVIKRKVYVPSPHSRQEKSVVLESRQPNNKGRLANNDISFHR